MSFPRTKWFFPVLLLLTASCSAAKDAGVGNILGPTKVWLTKIHLSADEDANKKEPIRFNIILIYDEALAKEVSEKTSTEYFKMVDQFKQKSEAKIFEKNLIPGKSKDTKIIIKNNDLIGVKAGYAFALYPSSQKSQKKELSEATEIRIIFHADDFTIDELKK